MPCKDKALKNTIKNIQKLKHESYKETIKTLESKAQAEFRQQKEAIAKHFPYIDLREANPGWENGKPQVHVGSVFYHISYNSLEVGYSLWLGEYVKTPISIDLSDPPNTRLEILESQLDHIKGKKDESMLLFIVFIIFILACFAYKFQDKIGEYLNKIDSAKQPELQQVELKSNQEQIPEKNLENTEPEKC